MDNSLIKRFINGVCRGWLANGDSDPERDRYTDIGFRAGYSARMEHLRNTEDFVRDFIQLWADYNEWKKTKSPGRM